MEDFDEGDNDLEEYMRAIGCASIEYDSKMKDAAIDMEEEKLNDSYSSSNSSERSEIVINVSYKPMSGSKLREYRNKRDKRIKEKGPVNFGLSINESKQSNDFKQLRQNPIVPEGRRLLGLDEANRIVKQTLKDMGFKLSISQPDTLGDGEFFITI